MGGEVEDLGLLMVSCASVEVTVHEKVRLATKIKYRRRCRMVAGTVNVSNYRNSSRQANCISPLVVSTGRQLVSREHCVSLQTSERSDEIKLRLA